MLYWFQITKCGVYNTDHHPSSYRIPLNHFALYLFSMEHSKNYNKFEFYILSMVLFRKIKKLIMQTDFFYSTEMLRCDAELQYKTLTGGIISLGIIITILVGFASMILNTLDLSSISTSTETVKSKDPTLSTIKITPDSPFRFAVQIWHLNLSDTRRYFDVTFQHWYWQNGNLLNATHVPLQTCNKQFFKDYPQITNSFDELGSGRWLCPPMNTTMQLYGQYSSKKYSEYIAVVSACNNATNPSQPCATPQQIQAYMDLNQNYIYFTVYFTNTQINSDKKSYKQYYIQDKSYSIFGSNIGTESFLYFTDYTVSTDYSIWPFANVVEDKGVLVEDLAVNHPFQTNINNVFVYFALVKGSDSIVYSREVQKLSAVFSFMGGMIGAVSAVLFFVKVYTSLSYEFSIAFQLFKPDTNTDKDQQSQQPQEHMSFNFFNFIRYNFYDSLKKLGLDCEWPPIIKYAKECRSQILKQLDVKALLKRIIFIQHCLNFMIQDYQLDALQINRPTNPHQIKLMRQKFESVIDIENIDNYPTEFQSELRMQFYQQKSVVLENSPTNRVFNERGQPSQKMVCFQLESVRGNSRAERSRHEYKDSQMINQIVIINADNVKESNANTPKQLSKKSQSEGEGKKQNQFQRIRKRTTYMTKLKQAAQEGNEMSNKIWKRLNQTQQRSQKHKSKKM